MFVFRSDIHTHHSIMSMTTSLNSLLFKATNNDFERNNNFYFYLAITNFIEEHHQIILKNYQEFQLLNH